MLGRYNFDRPKNLTDIQKAFPGLNIEFMTIHKAKGLEADYAVVINITAGKYGFPCEITDDPLIDLVLPAAEEHPNAEERRLFYVAVTRAKKRAYLISSSGQKSAFIGELRDKSYQGLIDFGTSYFLECQCPACEGDFIRRDGEFGRFWTCANYPRCKKTLPTCPTCAEGALIKEDDGLLHCTFMKCMKTHQPCPNCDEGFLVQKKGPYSLFWGCSKWRRSGPSCKYTKTIEKLAEPS